MVTFRGAGGFEADEVTGFPRTFSFFLRPANPKMVSKGDIIIRFIYLLFSLPFLLLWLLWTVGNEGSYGCHSQTILGSSL